MSRTEPLVGQGHSGSTEGSLGTWARGVVSNFRWPAGFSRLRIGIDFGTTSSNAQSRSSHLLTHLSHSDRSDDQIVGSSHSEYSPPSERASPAAGSASVQQENPAEALTSEEPDRGSNGAGYQSFEPVGYACPLSMMWLAPHGEAFRTIAEGTLC